MRISLQLAIALLLASGSFIMTACSSEGGSLPAGQGGATGSGATGGPSSTGSSGTSTSTTSTTLDTTGPTGSGGATGSGGSSGEAGSGSSDDAGMDSGAGGSGIGGGPVGDGGVRSYFDGTSLDAWIQKPLMNWSIMDMAIYGLGNARGFIYTKDKFTDYRVMFTLRQVSGNHKPTVLVYNQSPDLDAMGGIQFQPPQGGHWDYRPGHNDGGAKYFTVVSSGSDISTAMWARCEILVLSTGVARMACCQLPTGTGACKAKEILDFKDDPKNLSITGPFAIQVHNGGIHDEYKDITIES